MTLEDSLQPLSHHLEDLRATALKIFSVISLGFLLSLAFHSELFHLLTDTIPEMVFPLQLPLNQQKLLILNPVEGFSTSLKLCLWTSLLGTSPIWLFFCLQFLSPALKIRERNLILPFFTLSFLFLSLGVFFGMKFTLPIANRFFFHFNERIGINAWNIQHYLDFSVFLLMANALVFESFVLVILGIHYGLITADGLVSKRRHAIVFAAIIAAVATPPDVFTQLLLMIPLILMYEFCILYAKVKKLFTHID